MLFLADKFNAKKVERAAVTLGYDTQQRGSGKYETLFGIQAVHAEFGCFPTIVYRVPPNTTAKDVIGIERYFGREQAQDFNLLRSLGLFKGFPPISQATGTEEYNLKGNMEIMGNIDFKTFLEIFKLRIGSRLEDSLVKRIKIAECAIG